MLEASRTGPKPEIIHSMFSDIASRYDLANTVMSAGVHHLWRRKLVRWSGVQNAGRVLDCATGTGDLAIEFKGAVGSGGEVVGTDFCADMMATAPAKAERLGLNIHFETADAMHLPYVDGRFDISSIAFGIRNVQDPLKAIDEMGRVCKSGGAVMVLEFGQPSLPGFRELYQFYSRYILPRVGGWLTGQRTAYEYLQNSSSQFPCGNDFAQLMKATGRFSQVEFRSLSFGICYMYKGTVRS